MPFETELKKLGLTDKEACVYLACLQLGPSPVQPIARKAKVVRATTYVVLDTLMNRGLVTKYKEGKKTLFSAEPPRQLTRLLEKEQENLQEKQRELDGLLPELQILMKASGGQPTVRYFSGREGLRAIRQEIIMYSKPGHTIYNFTPVEHVNAVFPQENDLFIQQRAAKGVKSKTLFSTRSPKLRDLVLARARVRLSEARYLPPEFFPYTSGLTIFEDRIAIGTFSGKYMGVIIESEPMAQMMHALFEVAWLGAEHVKESTRVLERT